MPSKVARRGKGPRDQPQHVETAVDPPSKLLSSVLSTLSLTFEKDTGMLNGRYVRSVPDRPALIELKGQLDKLLASLKEIAESDRETIQAIERIRDARKVQEAQRTQEDRSAERSRDEGAGKPDANVQQFELKQDAVDAEPATGKPEEATPHASAAGTSSDEGSETTVIPKRRKRSLNIEIDDEEGDEVKLEKPTDNISVSPSKKVKLDAKNVADIRGERRQSEPMVKNPKSEFVVSQTLPAAAAALGLFNESGLESTGEENLKRKYDVASYPTNDLKDLLPGELPDKDFSHPKPTNQIQYGTFLSSVENFFRPLNDDDIKFLKRKYIIPTSLEMDKSYDPEVTSFVIPRLGPLYSNIWLKDQSSQDMATASPPPVSDLTSVLPRKSAADINDSTLETEDISCGPLVSRLLSAILKDENENKLSTNDSKVRIKEENLPNGILTSQSDSLNNFEETPAAAAAQTPMSETDESAKPLTGGMTSSLPEPHRWTINSINLDYPTFEERLKRELKYVGIYVNMPKDESNPTGDDPDWLTGREDDEISAELRELQNSLKQVTVKNQKRKNALIPLVERRLAWQEYSSILDDLDKQIDQAYVKRIRVPKKRKKNHPTTSSVANTESASQVAQQKAANSSLKALLDKRQRWITKIGPLFDRPEIMKRIPKESVFKDLDQEEEEEETDPFAQNGNSKEDELADA
ncbi:hypothetical protein HG536_0C00810 [Torulaspora globosa]|uniref:Uncharacterized protein n=1 Tax=Torulaspora globosa TaxID=48254 RepID=A0A7G3ZEH8_9SACH|nr:uncharacterized protein HG536_0C00810 [Torulaspora globosa]QLL31914.1 hypothetical protein HG536_0C00810 [Torulaspora globosa]